MGATGRVVSVLVVLGVVAAIAVFGFKKEVALASYTIEDKSGILEIAIRGWEGPVEPILDSFKSCQEGRCTCPTDEYRKLENLEVNTTEDAIILRLTPKPDMALDQNEIRSCLDYTLSGAGGDGATRD